MRCNCRCCCRCRLENLIRRIIIESGGTGTPGADGLTPFIGENGNWWIGTIDTGIPAQGIDGIDGLTPYIGDNGNWFVGDTDTGVTAQGPQGEPGPAGTGNLIGLQMQSQNNQNYVINTVLFDTVIYDNSGGAITWDGTAFSLNEQGTYKIDWEVVYDVTNTALTDVSIMFYANNSGYAAAWSPVNANQQGQASGSVLIDTFVLPLSCGLMNPQSETVMLANVPVQANITIVKIA